MSDVLIRINNTKVMLLKHIGIRKMSDKTELQRLIQDLYPEEQFFNKELTKMEKDVINFFSLLVNEYMKQKYKKNLLKEPDVP